MLKVYYLSACPVGIAQLCSVLRTKYRVSRMPCSLPSPMKMHLCIAYIRAKQSDEQHKVPTFLHLPVAGFCAQVTIGLSCIRRHALA